MFNFLRRNAREKKNAPNRRRMTGNSRDPNTLLKMATEQKKEGDINQAIETLTEAYMIIESSDIEYSIDTFLRLPMYLQAANRNDEAWAEFNKLLTKTTPTSRKFKSVLLMQHSTIYDKMRLFLQREKRFTDAVVQGVLSYIAIAQGRYYQVRDYVTTPKEEIDRADDIRSTEFIGQRIRPLLKKSGDLEKREEVCDMILSEFSSFPEVNKGQIITRLSAILKKN